MYEPRRALGSTAVMDVAYPRLTAEAALTSADARPKRAQATWKDTLADRAGVTLVALAASATAGSLILGGDASAAAVAARIAPVRDVSQVSRSTGRTVIADQLTSSKLASESIALVGVARLYAKTKFSVLAEPDADAKVLGSVATGSSVTATAELSGAFRQVEFGDGVGWVKAAQLTKHAPAAVAAGTTMEPCSRGSAVEGRLRNDTIHIYRSVCALFPAVNSYGGWRAGGLPFHKNGRALDIMLTPGAESALGHRIADYLIKNYKTFNIDHIIFEQKIWTPYRPFWRHMADRGGITANHYDHVHVAIKA